MPFFWVPVGSSHCGVLHFFNVLQETQIQNHFRRRPLQEDQLDVLSTAYLFEEWLKRCSGSWIWTTYSAGDLDGLCVTKATFMEAHSVSEEKHLGFSQKMSYMAAYFKMLRGWDCKY